MGVFGSQPRVEWNHLYSEFAVAHCFQVLLNISQTQLSLLAGRVRCLHVGEVHEDRCYPYCPNLGWGWREIAVSQVRALPERGFGRNVGGVVQVAFGLMAVNGNRLSGFLASTASLSM